MPVLGTDAYYAASVCAAVLGLRTGSRFERSLVRRQRIASSASCFTFDLAKGADLFVADVTALPNVTAEQLEAAVHAELDLVHHGGVTEQEVQRAVALTETHFVTSLQSAGERADQLSRFATYFGDPTLVNEQPARFRAVTAEQVSAFAREYLRADNRATLIYVPTGEPADADGETPDDLGAAA
jgi:predicted Zn-dependent peptidase